jgi:hypothetical protein
MDRKLIKAGAVGNNGGESIDSTVNLPYSFFGRLWAIADLCEAGDVDRTLRQLHRDVFTEWLTLSLRQQEKEILLWIQQRTSTQADEGGLLQSIQARLETLRPQQCLEPERLLFEEDARIVLWLIARQIRKDSKACQV